MDQTSINQQYDQLDLDLYDIENIKIDIEDNQDVINIRKQNEEDKIFISRCSIVATIIILCMYIPLVIGYKCYVCAGIAELEPMYSSTMLKMSLISSCTICIPMILYSLSNMYDRNLSITRNNDKNVDNSMNETLTSTLLMMLLLNIPDLYLLLIGIPYKQDDFISKNLTRTISLTRIYLQKNCPSNLCQLLY
jgi:hypothetical protein